MIKSRRRVYVHCHQGCDRSAAIVYGYLRYKFGRKLLENQLIKFMNIQRRVANEFPEELQKRGREDGKNIRDYYIVPVNAAVDELYQEEAAAGLAGRAAIAPVVQAAVEADNEIAEVIPAPVEADNEIVEVIPAPVVQAAALGLAAIAGVTALGLAAIAGVTEEALSSEV